MAREAIRFTFGVAVAASVLSGIGCSGGDTVADVAPTPPLANCGPLPPPATVTLPPGLAQPAGVTFHDERDQEQFHIVEGSSPRPLDELFEEFKAGVEIEFSENERTDAELALVSGNTSVYVVLRRTCPDRTQVRISSRPRLQAGSSAPTTTQPLSTPQ
ncbi:MAG TPA: hypothetical protein VNB24_09445 [Acidimicrobiales bacterium]|nr:hypothetical protein [Acidimicrobiales bacterium]